MIEKGIVPGVQLVQLMKGESVTLPSGEVVHPDDVTTDHRGHQVVGKNIAPVYLNYFDGRLSSNSFVVLFISGGMPN